MPFAVVLMWKRFRVLFVFRSSEKRFAAGAEGARWNWIIIFNRRNRATSDCAIPSAATLRSRKEMVNWKCVNKAAGLLPVWNLKLTVYQRFLCFSSPTWMNTKTSNPSSRPSSATDRRERFICSTVSICFIDFLSTHVTTMLFSKRLSSLCVGRISTSKSQLRRRQRRV